MNPIPEPESAAERICSAAEAVRRLTSRRAQGARIVFTNGCFDLLHRGHVALLEAAAAEGEVLIVGLNSDASVRRLKGARRPLVPQAERALLLAALRAVDLVVIFEEDTPGELIAALAPDVLVKGADYELDAIVGRKTVEARGGRIVRVPLAPGYSTSNLIARLTHGERQL